MVEGGFNLRKWQSNSPQLRRLVQDCDKLSKHEASHLVTKGRFWEEDDTYAKTTIELKRQHVLSANGGFLELIGITLKTV